jgi:hypothetical protein
MSRAGDFSAEARAAIMEAAGWRCVGCGNNAPLNCQHRIARGMGGTSNQLIGHPSNGVALCGSGSTGCHGWTESNPTHALALGWRVSRHEDPMLVPWWTRYGWRMWLPDLSVVTLFDDDTRMLNQDAITAYCRDRMVTL